MKRLICILSVLLLLGGCAQRKTFSVDRNSLNTEFRAEIGGEDFRGNISFDEKNNMHMTLTYPENISGFSLYFTDDSIVSSVNDVDNIHNKHDFSDDFAFSNLFNVLKKAVTDGAFSKIADSSYEMTYDGTTLVTDERGNITSARVKDGSFIFKHN